MTMMTCSHYINYEPWSTNNGLDIFNRHLVREHLWAKWHSLLNFCNCRN